MRKAFALLAIVIILSLVFSLTALASEKAEKEKGEHQKGAAWRIPGWQTIFAVLAIGYYIAVSLNLLPKIAAKELEEHH